MQNNPVNILHVEDDLADALLLQEMLVNSKPGNSNENYNIIHVDNLKDALTKIKEQGCSAVLLDLGLKDISGLDNVRVIKEENPNLPIVVLSGLDSEEMALKAVRGGAQEYIVKGHGDANVIRLAIKSSIERKAYERQLFQQANFDELTGLPNRRMFMEHLKNNLIKADRWKRQEAIMFLDLNQFKEINDTMGHEAGNRVIQQVACRLRAVLRMSDTLSRYGGDEFIVHLDDRSICHKESCCNIAEKIFNVLGTPFDLDGSKVQISISIGIAIYPYNGRTVEDLIKNADKAMYTAKRIGPNKYWFSE